MSRYKSSDKYFNEGGIYQEFLDERGVSRLEQFRTPKWIPLTEQIRDGFTYTRHVWSFGDTYWKLSNKFYGNPKLWWVLAWFNRKPTEAHIKAGEIILIPAPVQELLSLFEYGTR